MIIHRTSGRKSGEGTGCPYCVNQKVDLNNFQPPVKPMDLPRTISLNYNNDSGDGLISADLDYDNLELSESEKENMMCALLATVKAIREKGCKKIITYHSTIKKAKII